ncbi:alpha/beta hydrolase [Cryptosporangium sp. NPDC048952]|uniref:alpha/beta hydrolase n=1 Tax=Cryptosporangium sp. NPDC048952 TaxID=3363961 RepID=UPI00371E1DBD
MPPSELSAALAAGVLVLAACSPSSTASQTDDSLQRFYDQKLTFSACDGYATTPADTKLFASSTTYQCARLEVPLDYDDPDGDTAQIAMLRVPARGKSLGPLVLNSGGPGGTGMNFAAITATNLAKSPVTERFDLIGFDPRGIGATKPAAKCFTPEDLANENGAIDFLVTDTKGTAADTQRLADHCTELSGGEKVVGSFASRDVARDMDVLRAALGQDKLNFLGQSYGTRIGALYAREFPQNVRAMVIDGAVDPQLGFADRRVGSFAAFQKAFDGMAADCASKPNCGLGQDPNRALEVYQSAMQPLVTKPLAATDGRKLTFNAATGFVISALYDPVAWPFVTKAVGDIAQGDPASMLAVIDRLATASAAGGNFPDASFAINCMDNERLTPEQAVDLRKRLWEAAPFLDPGHGPEGARDACEAWPVESKPTTPFPERVEGLPPTLTVSITNDTTTPHSGGISLAKTLGGSLLTVDGWGHTIAPGGKNACVNAYVADYLVNLTTPPADARCAG